MMKTSLKRKGNKKASKFELFDDCSICQAMKEGKASTEKELRAAFRKSEKHKHGIGFK